jgi:nucleolar protein 53
MTLNMAGSAPKIKKNASRKNKKSWRKNVDMTEVEEYLEEKRFEERMGGQ